MGLEGQDFRTVLPLGEYPFRISHTDPIVCWGSCFAEHMAQKMQSTKFDTLLNPLGITYNPDSIGQGIKQTLAGEALRKESLFAANGLWHSFDFHSRFSHPEQDTALAAMNSSIAKAHSFWQQAKVLIVTLGTATAFRTLQEGQVVNNCHKLPANVFVKTRLDMGEMQERLGQVFSRLKEKQQELQIILTVSPVRHIKDGLVENQRSKATLLLLAEQLENGLDFVHYFPAYELVIDDLRDYRFFEPDLVHPNGVAVNYVWQYFQQSFFTTETQQLMKRIRSIVQASQHRPFHPKTSQHQQFLAQQLHKITELKREYPALDFSEEESQFNHQIIS